MKEVLDYLSEKSAHLAMHPLYSWICEQHTQNPERKLDAAVPLLGFIVTFPYYNELYLKCDEEQFAEQDQSIVAAINEHALEDSRHLQLFVHDMKQFQLDKRFGLKQISDLLWVIWSAPMLQSTRQLYHNRIKSLLLSSEDLFSRYLHIEQLEADGHLLFSAFTNAAEKITQNKKERLLYFGALHLEKEEGHVCVPFEHQELESATQSSQAIALVKVKHSMSLSMNDIMLDFVQKTAHLTNPSDLLNEERALIARRVQNAVAHYQQGLIPDISWTISPSEHCCDAPLYSLWHSHHQRFLDHPLFDFLTHTDQIEDSLRLVMIYFANRMLSLNTLNLFDLESEDDSDFTQAFRSIRHMFSTHFALFFYDWETLEIDQHIQVNCPEFLQLMFQDKQHAVPEMHALHEFRRQAIQVATTPALKFGCYLAINSMASAFTKATKVLAQKYFQSHGKLLPYMSGTLHLCYQEKDLAWNDSQKVATLYAAKLNQEEMHTLNELFQKICSLGMHQWDLLNHVLRSPAQKKNFL